MTRDSTQLVAAVTTVLVILISITLVTEMVTEDSRETVYGDWYLTERYSIGDGGSIERHSPDGSECLSITDLSGNDFTGTFSGENISGTFVDNTVSIILSIDGADVGFSGIMNDDILTISSVWTTGNGHIHAEELTFSRETDTIAPVFNLPDSILIDQSMMLSECSPMIIDSGGHLVIAEDGNGSTYILIIDHDGLGGHGMISSGGTLSHTDFTVSEGTIVI